MRAFERLVNDRLREHLEGMGFFTPQQAGFRKGLSTLDNIYQLLQVVYAALSQRKRLPVLFLDIVKAFDRVPHSHLLYKLYEQGKVQGKAWGWLRAFLADRRFRMTSGRLCSSWFSASAGVPQGCVLSPLLFGIYINDMDKDTQGVLLTLFADDGCAWPVLSSGMQFRTAMKRIRAFGDSMSEWSQRWKLRFSPSKTQMVIFGKPDPPKAQLVRISGARIAVVDSQRYLGLHFNRNGKWNSHYNALLAKARYTANLIARINRSDGGVSPMISCTLVKAML